MEIKDIFITKADEWGTPKEFFDKLDKEFNFTLDPCGDKSRILKEGMITWDISDNGLTRTWRGHRVYCNPPYSKEHFRLWCEKINQEKEHADAIVLLMPLRKLSNKYVHYLILGFAELRVVKGRLDFYPLKNQDTAAANPSGNAICIMASNRFRLEQKARRGTK